jgi:hypothetical protein
MLLVVTLRTFGAIVVVALLAWPGCGGESSSDEPAAAGGSASGTAGRGGQGGASGTMNGGGRGGADGGASGSGAGGAGGEPAAGGAGTPIDPVNPNDCNVTYTGPSAGPRAGGPQPVMTGCDAISDDILLARYDELDEKVPEGLFWEPPPGATWQPPCSDSPEETAASGANLGALEDTFTTDWFYEATFCEGSQRRLYRNLRCDYFDGSNLANPSGEELVFLMSLLWWQQYFNMGGSAVIGYAVMPGDATDWVEFCTIGTVYGDFGLCDEITLTRWSGTVVVNGEVNLGEPEVVRVIQGECH